MSQNMIVSWRRSAEDTVGGVGSVGAAEPATIGLAGGAAPEPRLAPHRAQNLAFVELA
jgi:hypothetical protein